MKLSILAPSKSLSKAYLKQSLKREQIELFKANLGRMFERIRTDEHEEHLKNIVSDGYCHAKYAQKSQKWFLDNSAASVIDFIGSLDIFEEASVNNGICLFERRNGTTNHPARRLHQGEFGTVRLLPSDEQRNLSHRAFFPEETENKGFSVPTVSLVDICYISK